jgi:hypothetical protein
MDYEQRYKEALEKIRKGLQPLSDGAKISGVTRAFLEEVFPELKESEDEKIRKWLIAQLELKSDVNNPHDLELMILKSIAWLEKQGEQRKQLINKACDVLVNCIEDFMSRRMEVWDGECKKQTLENIRKTLEE